MLFASRFMKPLFEKVSIQSFLLFLVIVLIPSNLFLKFIYPGAYVHGILVDFLLPKLYLSDFPIIALLILWIVTTKIPKAVKKITGILCLASTVHLFFVALFSPSTTLSTAWFVVKLFEMVLFMCWLVDHRFLLKGRIIILAICTMLLIQTPLAIYQNITQHQVFGYWFLGEPTLNVSPEIAKTDLPGSVRILPYGTTPHPNILAGISVASVGFLIYAGATPLLIMFALLNALLIISLTYSLSALIALVLGIGTILYIIRDKSKEKTKIERCAVVGVGILCAITLVFLCSPLLTPFLNPSQKPSVLTSPSILRRAQLEQIAVNAFLSSPLEGVGLNRFTIEMERFGTISANTKFLQPTHNIPLLYLAETGLIGVLFFILFF
ncbi:MAG: O-antigen ligase family protein, partial [Patescibacteria group bacterium]